MEEEDAILQMSFVELKGTKRSDVWFVDSGCLNHMCGDRVLILLSFILSKPGNNKSKL